MTRATEAAWSGSQPMSRGTRATSRVDWAQFGVQALVIGVLLTLLYWNVLRTLVSKWLTMGDWSHGFLIPVFSLYYLYLQRDRFPAMAARPGYPGALILAATFVFYLYSTVTSFTYLQSLCLVLTIFGVVYLVCGWPMARWSWFGVAFLLFALPLPGQVYEQITMPLQKVASRSSTPILNLMPGVTAEAENVIISYTYEHEAVDPTRQGADGRPVRRLVMEAGSLNVEQACSGIRLLMTFAALGVAMAFASDRPLWHRMIMVLSCVPIAVFCNVVRVTTTGVFKIYGYEEWTRGSYHAMLGMGMLVIAFGLFGAISYVLGHLFVDAPGEEAPAPGRPASA